MEFLSFTLEDKFFGIPLENVKEIVEEKEITPVPLSSDYLEGVMNLRGEPITVIDLRKKIGLTGKSTSREIILCIINGMVVGLRPDRVLDIHEVSGSEIKNVPSSLKGEIESKYMKGIVKLKEKYIIIDIKELI
ncbi:purine-binding chemotaxis protein CheW [candidate division WOR-3 bacterium]|nr:purine-binding chemotaxis protein CheW [candidate division WOR-3 bacterium]